MRLHLELVLLTPWEPMGDTREWKRSSGSRSSRGVPVSSGAPNRSRRNARWWVSLLETAVPGIGQSYLRSPMPRLKPSVGLSVT